MAIEIVTLVTMVVFAFMAIQAKKLRRAVIYLGVFSLLSSFAYLLCSAPDVALAEAAIGCTLTTVLYLVAVKKYKVFTIFYITEDSAFRPDYLHALEECLIASEYEPQVVCTHLSVERLQKNHTYDFIVDGANTPIIYYLSAEPEFAVMDKFLSEYPDMDVRVSMMSSEEEKDD